ncbi:MAG: DUF814 domain-containing protein [Deltaproteobacteria bacterium]|nr:DUF814 domain-containing protein [Deltaproteobacteria bacterium]
MDEQSLEMICAALAEDLPGTFITKIHQMTPYHLLLRLRGGGQSGEQRLMISVAPMEPGLHLTTRRYLNPPRPLRFCAYLRHHLQGAKITALAKSSHDRIVTIKAVRKDGEKQLIIEFTGKHSNVILCRGDNRQIGARIFESATDARLQPGVSYTFPETPASINTKKTSGLLTELIRRVHNSTLSDNPLPPASWQQLYDDWFYPRYHAHYGSREIKRLEKALRRHEKRLQKRKKNLLEESHDKRGHINDSQLGDLLKGALHRLQRGATTITLTNYWSPALEEVKIALNPALSPLANLEKFYKNAKKARRGLEIIEKRLQETRHEEEYTAELLYQFEALKNTPVKNVSAEEQELLDLASDLAERKLGPQLSGKNLRDEKKHEKTGRKPQLGVERINGIDGGIIYIGRNAFGNENIYRHLSAPDDLWFHVRNRPGAHVLLKTAPGRKSSTGEQHQAATLAAVNSREQNEKQVEVSMIQVKYLKKPKGGRPGQVLLAGPLQTLMIDPQKMTSL